MKGRLAGGTLLLAAATLLAQPAQPPEKGIDLKGVRPGGAQSLEALWASVRKGGGGADREGAAAAMREIERLRVERNIASLEAIAGALVGRGLDRLERTDREGAENDMRQATALDESLPDAYFGLARVQEASGPLGYLAALKTRADGFLQFVGTPRGGRNLSLLAWPAAFLTLFAVTTMWAISLLVRYGSLLRHDLEERLGPRRARSWSLGLFALVLAVPLVAQQGYGWLPLWWLALMFVYMTGAERVITGMFVLAAVAVGPAAGYLEQRARVSQAPLFRAMEIALTAGPDDRALQEVQRASTQDPEDRDLAYLAGILVRKAGRYEDAALLYRGLLAQRAGDVFAGNNLANLDFANHEFGAAIARYKQLAETAPPAPIEATLRYNLSLAYLQRFERQQAEEARGQAERLAPELVRGYDAQWQYRNGEYAVVDLTLSPEQLWAKFDGKPVRIVKKNLAGQNVQPFSPGRLLGGLLNRFSLAGLLLVAFVTIRHLRRGARMFTARCMKCGTPFCRRCHLGAVVGGLCTQCHHLFVVRDGVSGPARNQKLLEVQGEEERRDRMFRALSLFSPGSGQIYGLKPVLGLALGIVWYGVLVVGLMAGRLFPVTEVPGTIGGYGGWLLGALLLAGAYLAGNWLKPEAEISAAFSRSRRTRS